MIAGTTPPPRPDSRGRARDAGRRGSPGGSTMPSREEPPAGREAPRARPAGIEAWGDRPWVLVGLLVLVAAMCLLSWLAAERTIERLPPDLRPPDLVLRLGPP